MKKQSMYSLEAKTIQDVAVAIADFDNNLPENEHIVSTGSKLSKRTKGDEDTFYHITIETYTGDINDLLPNYGEHRY